MNSIKYLLLGIFLIFIQLFISGYVNIWPMLYIVVFPLLFIVLPYNTNTYISLLAAFGLGLLTDIMSDGVLGLNAAASVAVVFFKKPVLHLILNKSTLENLTDINEGTLGGQKLILLNISLYSIFFLCYTGLDGIGYFSFLHIAFRFIINVFVNTIIIIILEKTLIKQLFH